MALVDVPAPMNGTVFELVAAVGDAVNEGDELLILESMKMEIPVESPQPGSVAEILVAPEQQIEEGQILLQSRVLLHEGLDLHPKLRLRRLLDLEARLA